MLKTLLAAYALSYGINASHAFAHFVQNSAEEVVNGGLSVKSDSRILPTWIDKQKPRLQLVQVERSTFSVYDVSGEPGAPIPVNIILSASIEREYTFIMIRGIPLDFQVSVGFRAKDAWALSLQDIKSLTVTPPANFQGTVPLEILLVRGSDISPETRQIVLTVRASRQSEAMTARVETTIPKVQEPTTALKPILPDNTPQKKLPAISVEEEEALLTIGAAVMKQGNISAARLMFEELAVRGSSKCAFALAQTYDPVILKATMISGIKPDLVKAQFWYEKARSLGNLDAEKRLSEMRAGR